MTTCTATPHVLLITDARTRWAHLVTDDDAAAGHRTGRYAALCGTEVLAASLTTPELGYCQACANQQAAR